MTDVPCNGCTLCCKADAVGLGPEELQKYEHEKAPWNHRCDYTIAHKPNGDCHYLTPEGCSVHEDKPICCRNMDCRIIAKCVPRRQSLQLGADLRRVWRKGHKLNQKLTTRKKR